VKKLALALIPFLALAVAWLMWPRATPVVTKHVQDARSAAPSSAVVTDDPTAAGELEVTAAAANVIAIHSATFQRAVTGDHASLPLPAGHYIVFASGPDGVARGEADVRPNETTRLELKLVVIMGATLGGTVHDILGGVVGGAEVWVGDSVAQADAAGVFALRLPLGDITVVARAPGYAATTEHLDFQRDTKVDLVLQPAATLRGLVVHADGQPAGGARVVLARREGFDTFADENGHFTFDGLGGGEVIVRASTATEIKSESVRLAPASTRDVRIELEGAIGVFGIVRGADGQPVRGAKVIVKGNTRSIVATAESAANGQYRVSPLEVGHLYLEACADDHVCAHVMRFFDKTPTEPVDFVLNAASSLRVHVVDAQGAAVAGAHVSADGSDCTTDASGDCAIGRLAPGATTMVNVEHPTAGFFSNDAVKIVDGETLYTARLAMGATVRGTVRWDDGKPAVDVEAVTLDAHTRTGPDGRYELRNVEPRSSFVRARTGHELGAKAVTAFVMAVESEGESRKLGELKAGDVREGMDLVLHRPTTKKISGVVLADDRTPLAGARVGVVPEKIGNSVEFFASRFADVATYASADGTFTIDSLSNEAYTLWADGENLPHGEVRNVRPGGPDVVITLPRGATIEGTVADEHGPFQGPIQVSIGQTSRRFTGPRFTWSGLNPGSVAVVIEAAGATGMTGTKIGAGQTTTVSITLVGLSTVTGRVTSPTGKPLSGMAIGADGPGAFAPPTGPDGRFRIEGVRRGQPTFFCVSTEENWTRDVKEPVVDIGDLIIDGS
jgi:hypothetical protein